MTNQPEPNAAKSTPLVSPPLVPRPLATAIAGGLITGLITGLVTSLALSGALAMSGTGGGSSSTGTRSLQPKLSCPSGWEVSVDAATKEAKCVRKTSQSEDVLPAVGWEGASPDFVAAAVLVHAGDYERAIEAFTALGTPADAYVQGYLGYANRKLGRIELALGHYQEALRLRPDYTRVRSYLGEGYAELGRLDEAREQLAAIESVCGQTCEEYRMLDAAIARASGATSG